MTWKKVQKLSQPSIKLVWTFSLTAFNENVMQRNELVGSCCVTHRVLLGAEWQLRWVGWGRWREVQGGWMYVYLCQISCCCTQNQHNIVKQVSSNWVSHVVLVVNTHLPMQEKQETQVQSLSWEDPLEEGMATHSGILAWRIPWTEELGGLQSTGLQRARHDWSYVTCPHLPIKNIYLKFKGEKNLRKKQRNQSINFNRIMKK